MAAGASLGAMALATGGMHFDGLADMADGIGGGGRYDGLVEQLGGREGVTGVGFGLGVDRTLLALAAEGKRAPAAPRVVAFGVPLGDAARDAMVPLLGRLRSAGVASDMAYGNRAMKGAMKAADRSGARFALILGDAELEQGVVMVKDLAKGEQRALPIDTVVGVIVTESAASAARRRCRSG